MLNENDINEDLDHDPEDEYYNELVNSGEYPTGFDDPEEIDDDFLI